MNNNAFENDIYQLLKTSESSDPDKIDKIIRHYKVIIRNNYNNEVSVVKYIKDNNGKVIKYNKDIYPDITENDIIAYKYTLRDAISQDTDNYLNENIYSYNFEPMLTATDNKERFFFIRLEEYAITIVCGTKSKSQIYNSFPCFAHI